MKTSALLLLLSLVSGHALVSAIDHYDAPNLVWQTQTDVILDGNGVFISPDDSIAVVTQANGNLNAYDPFTGEELWKFVPPANDDKAVACNGGVTFSNDGYNDYLIYSVVDDPNGITSFTRVVSLGYDGTLNWISTPLEGAAAGSPLASFDGRYIYLTHNSNAMSVGHFSVLDSLDASLSTPVFPLYSEFNTTNPFSPPGIFHNPEEGFYDGGQGNTNDIVVWGHAPNPLENRVGFGSSFVFQFPIGYGSPSSVLRQGEAANATKDMSRRLFWLILGDDIKDWQTESAPVLTNQGRSLYWSVTRSQFRAWVGSAGTNVARFNRGRTNSPEFERGSPRFAACPNTPALSSSTTEPMIFAGTAGNEFVKMDYLMDEDTALIRNTTSKVRNRAIVSPDDQFVYFTEFSGVVHQASTVDLTDSWTLAVGNLDGEFALSSDGSMLIVGDVTGNVHAYQVATRSTPYPTEAPSPAPSSDVQPTTGFRPTVDVPIPGSPTMKPTRSPIFQPVISSTDAPEDSSSAFVTSHASAFVALIAGLLMV